MSITLTTVILFAVFGVLLFLGVPISISIVVSSIVTAMSTLSWDQITFITMQKMNSGVSRSPCWLYPSSSWLATL